MGGAAGTLISWPAPGPCEQNCEMSSNQLCAICGGRDGGIVRLELADRIIPVCRADALRARQAGADSAEALRELFTEADGRRALLPRRAPDERRMFPPRPEGRRYAAGRRGSDAARKSRA
jgi:hypothetical protein